LLLNIKNRFDVNWVNDILQRNTDSFFSDFVYFPENYEANGVSAVALAKKIRDQIRDSNKTTRYKISVQCFIGEKRDQKVVILAKGFWDNYLDNYATYTYNGDNFYSTVIVWGIYTD